jgi:SAM-dependent methyltransferase
MIAAMKTYRAIPQFYDDEYADLEMLGHDVGYLLAKIRTPPADVLMLACGTGRAAIPVAQAGHRVLGVDIDPAMIETAVSKRDSARVAAKYLRFEVGDLLSWSTRERFDHAAILFNSFLLFTTIEEQDRVLGVAQRQLRKGGTLLVDVFNPDLARIADDDAQNADVRIFFSQSLNTTIQRVTHVRSTRRPQVRETIFHYSWFDERQRRKTKTLRFELTYLFAREMTLLLERNGFAIESIVGDYDGSPVDADSARIIAHARKR